MKKLTLLTLSILCVSSFLNAGHVIIDESKIKADLMAGGASEEEAEAQAHAAIEDHALKSEKPEKYDIIKKANKSYSGTTKRRMLGSRRDSQASLLGSSSAA